LADVGAKLIFIIMIIIIGTCVLWKSFLCSDMYRSFLMIGMLKIHSSYANRSDRQAVILQLQSLLTSCFSHLHDILILT